MFGKNTKKLYGKAAEKTTKQKKKEKEETKKQVQTCLFDITTIILIVITTHLRSPKKLCHKSGEPTKHFRGQNKASFQQRSL